MDKLDREIFNKYLEIKQDLVNNLSEVFNRDHYYTHKYRGSILTDINVALAEGPRGEKIIQIFIRRKGRWIKDVLSLYAGKIHENEVTTNLYNE